MLNVCLCPSHRANNDRLRLAGNLMMSCLAAIATDAPDDMQMADILESSIEAQKAMANGPDLREEGGLLDSSPSMW